MRLLAPLVAAFLLLFSGTLAFAVDVGTAVGVRQSSDVTRAGTTDTLSTDDVLAIGDVITTGSSGQVQIEFTDGTRMVVGPNSSLEIEEYLLRNADTVSRFAVNALNGTFRFISGDSPSDAYEINTPNGTIGIRGTAFDFFVGPYTAVLQLEDTSELCGPAGCVTIANICEVGVAEFVDQETALLIGEAKEDVVGENFPYLRTQFRLLRDFRVEVARQCAVARNRNTGSSIYGGTSNEEEEDCYLLEGSVLGNELPLPQLQLPQSSLMLATYWPPKDDYEVPPCSF